MHSLKKAFGAFQKLRGVYEARGIGRRTKISLFSRPKFERSYYMGVKLGRSPRTMNGS